MKKNNYFPLIKFSLCGIIAENVPRTVLTPSLYSGGIMKKIFFLFAAVMSLLVVGCRDVLLEKNTGGFSVSFQTPGSGSRSGTTAMWKLDAWLELESGAQLQKKDDTVLANAPITITFDAVPIGTKLKVQVRLEDSENSLIQHEGSSDWITVDAESKTVEVQVQRKIVNAAAPSITTQPEPLTKDYKAGDEVSWMVPLTVAATTPDGGKLSYEWFENTANSNSGGTLIPEATEEAYQVTLTPGETKYFYCVVTNTNDAVNGTKAATTTSSVAKLVYNIAQSGVLLWNNDSVKIVPHGNLGETGTQVIGVQTMPPSWCFDNTGNFYVIGSNGGSRYSLENGGIYNSYTNFSGSNLRYVSYDNETSTLYGMSDSVISKIIENQSSSPVIDSLANDGVQTPIGFAVHNNIAYVACFSRTEEPTADGVSWKVAVTIFEYNLIDSSSGPLSSNEIILPPIFLSTTADGSAPTSQMIYQDGALYLLLGSRYIENNKAGYSVGTVVKINAGNAGNLAVESSFGQNGYLGLLTSPTKINDKDCYAPTEEDENYYFYGPMGFVAIMPKQLVIADAGFAMSAADDGTENVKLSKKSRIVTIDLETEAFESVPMDGYYEPTYSTGCGFVN